MARTPLASRVEELALTRRQFLGAAGAAAVSVAAWTPRARAATAGQVVIVGGGPRRPHLRVPAQAGRRRRGAARGERPPRRPLLVDPRRVRPGLVAEHGGELIDTGHIEMRQLAKELGFATDNLLQGETNGTEPLYYFDGRPYTFEEAHADYDAVYQKLHKDVSAASYPTTYRISTPRGRELDAMTITEWIEESVPGGVKSRFGQLLDVAYNIEFGAECDQQSALNLLYLLGYVGQGQLRLFGKSNEKYHVRGGNDQVALAMAAALRARSRWARSSSASRRPPAGATR